MAIIDYEALDKEADALLAAHNELPQEDAKEEVEEIEEVVKVDEPIVAPVAVDTDSAEKLRIAEERIHNTQSKMHQIAQEKAELKRKLDAATAELAQAKQPPKAYNIEQLSTEYPDIIPPLLSEIGQLRQELSAITGSVKDTVSRIDANEASAADNKHIADILAVHPDAIAVRSSPEFEGWIAGQPRALQAIIESGTSSDVNWLLSQYKGKPETSKPKPQISPDLPRARTAATEGKPRFTRDQIKNMSVAEFTKYESAIDEAMASGLII